MCRECYSATARPSQVSVGTDYVTAGVEYPPYISDQAQDWPRVGMLGMRDPEKVGRSHSATTAEFS